MKKLKYPLAPRCPLPELSRILKVCGGGLASGLPPESQRVPFAPDLQDAERQLSDCIYFLSGIPVLLKPPYSPWSSYGLKHEIERWLRAKGRAEPNYIGNWVCIIALMLFRVPL